MSGSEYFFELLSEEIPAWMLQPKLDAIRDQLTKIVADFSGTAVEGSIITGATPRRIYFAIGNLPEKQADREEEVKGPPLKAAFKDGEATPALQGFLKKNNATRDAVIERGEYVWIKRQVAGQSAAAVLQAEVPRLIEGIRWPKMMRWGRGEHSYIRPIHSVVSILDGAPLPITIFGTASSNTTSGHRVFSRETFEVDSYAGYGGMLRSRFVVVNADERVMMMRQRADELAREVGGVPATDESIWEQWRFLTEYPGLVRAEFEERFLALPEEVLVTVMRVHQKQLPIRRGERLTSSFLAVVDQHRDEQGNARIGNAFVTNARFADAQFFYETDRKRTLSSRLGDLEHLQFQEKLGDYRRKTERLTKLAESIRALAAASTDAAVIRQAAELCKTDLVTEMVKEFTDLQGKIGGIYAREEGEAETVWQAVYDHYLPLSTDGAFPRNEAGAIVSLADKLDTLAGFFSIGLKPTGSKDPFALRRAAQGAVQLLLNRAGWKINAPVDRLVDAALANYESTDAAARADLMEFMAERVRTLLETSPFKFAYDEIAAVMAAGWTNLHDTHDRLDALRVAREDTQFLSILDSAKRIANITANSEASRIDSSLLQLPTEQRLAALVDVTSEQVDELIDMKQYTSALESFAALAPELEQFFDDVMVMVEDTRVRDNRIALLRRCGNVVGRIADVTRIVVDRREYKR